MKKLKTSSWFLCPGCTQAFTLRIKLKRHVESYHRFAEHHPSKSGRNKGRRGGGRSKVTTNEARKTRSRKAEEKGRRDEAQAKYIANRDGESSKVSQAAEQFQETTATTSVKRFELFSRSPVSPPLDTESHSLSSVSQGSSSTPSPQQLMGSTTGKSESGREAVVSIENGKAAVRSDCLSVGDTSRCSSTGSPAPLLQQAPTGHPLQLESLNGQNSTEENAPGNTCKSPISPAESIVQCLKPSVSPPQHVVECAALKQRLKCRKKFIFFGQNLKKRKKLPWRCPYCPVRFVSSLDFYQHISSHKGEPRKNVHSAAQTKESKDSKGSQPKQKNIEQRLHQQLELNHPESVTSTKVCSDSVKMQEQKLSSDTEYKCPACSESYRQFSRISAHVQYDHNLSEYKALSWLVNHIADDYGSFQAYTEHQPERGEALLRCTLCTTSDVLWERRLFWTHLTSFHNFSLGAAFHMSGSLKLKSRGTIEKRPEIGKTEMTVNTVGDNAAFNNISRSSAVVLPPLNYFDTPAPLPADLMRLPTILQTARTQFAQRICPRVGD